MPRTTGRPSGIPSILEAIADPALLGASPAFANLESWRAWLTFLAAGYGLELDPEGESLFRRATGRSAYVPPEGGFRELACVVGRQAGKTVLGAAIVAYEAAFAPPCRTGELYALLLAQDHRAAMRAAFSYIVALFDASPILRRAVVSRTADTLALENGVRVAAYPCRPHAIRGLRACVAVLDELAFYIASDARRTDTETLRAVRPCLATTGGRLVILSSPYAQIGALWDLHRRHYGRDDSSTLVWQADAPTMNPTLPADYLARMERDDPEAYRSEVLGEFRAGLSTLFDPEALEACVVTDRRELPPAAGVRYVGFADPSGGRGDSFTLAIAHEHASVAIVDALRAWRPPFSPAGVVAECAQLLERYGCRRVIGDRYAGEWPREAFRAHRVEYETAAKPKSDLYLDLLAAVNSASVELPDDAALLRELRTLERRREPSGRDRVDHPPHARDDLANAVAGVACELLARRQRGLSPSDLYGPDGLALGGPSLRAEFALPVETVQEDHLEGPPYGTGAQQATARDSSQRLVENCPAAVTLRP